MQALREGNMKAAFGESGPYLIAREWTQLHQALGHAVLAGEEGAVLARHIKERLGGPCVVLRHGAVGWLVAGAEGIDARPGDVPPGGTDPATWLAQIAGGVRLVGRRLHHGGRTVGMLLVDESRLRGRLEAREALARACELGAPFLAASDQSGRGLSLHLAELAHDLRRPLSTIRISLELLAGSCEGRAVDRCRRAVLEMNDLVEDLLAFKARPVRSSLSISTLLDELIDEQQPNADEAGVNLVLRVEREAPVAGEERALQRALDNVISNALQASPRGGTVELIVDATASELVIQVRDAGPGVPPQLRDRVFEPYFTTRETGTGLGLAVARAVAQAHGGTAQFLDGPGGLFEIRLPRADRAWSTV